MNLDADRRGRVPFALVGVLLLLGASAYATGVATRGPTEIDRDAAAASDAAVRDLRPALHTAIEHAAREAVRHPVITPADTPAGRVLDDSQPFRDALRLRIALAAREAATTIERRHGDAVATVSLPPVESVADLRGAIRDVRVAGVRDGTAMQVTVRNVTITVRESGRVISRDRFTTTLTVDVPALALHDRTTRFERRLNREPLAGPGLGRGLTVRLYPVAWGRGYAQYAGAPVIDVLGNHHVELATNAVVLQQQRRAFGRVDPDAPPAGEVATVRVLTRDLLVPAGGRVGEAAAVRIPDRGIAEAAGQRLGAATAGTLRTGPDSPDGGTPSAEAGSARAPVSVSPDAAADAAFVELTRPDTLDAVLRDAYRVEAGLTTTVTRIHDGRVPPPVPPGKNWTLIEASTAATTVVWSPAGSTVRRTDGRSAVFRTVREVTVRHAIDRTWRHGNGETRTVSRRWTDRSRVVVAVHVRHSPVGRAPDRPVDPTFRSGGALGGPNLGGALAEAEARLLGGNGGVDSVARRAVEGRPLTREASFVGAQPVGIEPWVVRDLQQLRRRIGNVSVQVSRERVAAGRANPPAAMSRALRSRRAALLDAPPVYDGVADRARVDVRAAYLAAVLGRLDRRAEIVHDRNEEYVDAIGAESAATLARFVSLSGRPEGPQDRKVSGIAFVPDGSPAYLSVAAVDRNGGGRTGATHPLTVRTHNWFALPHADAGQAIGNEVLAERRVGLATAGQALVSAEAALDRRPDATLRERRNRLDEALGESLAVIRRQARREVRDGTGLSRVESDRVVRAALARWDGRGDRALAAANGSLASAVASEARARGVSEHEADLLAIRLRVELRRTVADQRVTVSAAVTNRTASATRRVAAAATEELVAGELDRVERRAYRSWTGIRARSTPSGLPIAPVPGYWYATVNAWSVTVRGEYGRFAVAARGGPPDGAGAVVRYVRDGSTVRLDVDGDGEAERIGRSDRVAFEVSTTVVVAVPPGPPGVGDVDGDRDERSPGWPCPGPEESVRMETVEDCP